jgi:hypothetical protein
MSGEFSKPWWTGPMMIKTYWAGGQPGRNTFEKNTYGRSENCRNIYEQWFTDGSLVGDGRRTGIWKQWWKRASRAYYESLHETPLIANIIGKIIWNEPGNFWYGRIWLLSFLIMPVSHYWPIYEK